MKDDTLRWKTGLAEKTLRVIGITESQFVLDFGCGEGRYTLPIARILGEKGRIYALDQEQTELDKLASSIESERLTNCKTLLCDDMPIELPDDHLDIALLFDVLHYYYFSDTGDRVELLRELSRVLKPDGALLLYPKHLDEHSNPSLGEVKDELEAMGFRLFERKRVTMIHEKVLEMATVMKYIIKR